MKTCPRCHKKYSQYPALSRRDNKTDICPRCGEEEAVVDYLKSIKELIPYSVDKREFEFAHRLKWIHRNDPPAQN